MAELTGYLALAPPADDDAAGWKAATERLAGEYNRLAGQLEDAWRQRDQLLEAVRAHREADAENLAEADDHLHSVADAIERSGE